MGRCIHSEEFMGKGIYCWGVNTVIILKLKPGFYMSGKFQTIGDFAVSRPSQISPTNKNTKS